MTFEADLQPYGGDLIASIPVPNGYYGNVVWKGNQYRGAYPIAVESSSQRTKGPMPGQQWLAAGVTGLITGIIRLMTCLAW